MLAESEVDEELVCETSVSEFESRRSTQLEGAAKWLATGLVDVDFSKSKPGYGFRRGISYGDAARTIPPPSVSDVIPKSNAYNSSLLGDSGL